MMVPEELKNVISYCNVCKRDDFNHEHRETSEEKK